MPVARSYRRIFHPVDRPISAGQGQERKSNARSDCRRLIYLGVEARRSIERPIPMARPGTLLYGLGGGCREPAITRPAPVAQGIEHRPPEAGAQVRILPGA